MKKFTTRSFIVLLTFVIITPIYPQWVKTNLPALKSVNTFVIHVEDGNSILFAGTSNGVFRTSDNGETWDSVNTGLTDPLTNRNVLALLSTGGDLFAGTYDGVYRYDNSEGKWEPANNGFKIPPDKIVRTLISKDSTIFAGTASGVFSSTNNGSLWIKLFSPPDDIEAIAIMDSNIFASQGISRDAPGLYLSTDYGKNWVDIYGASRVQTYTSFVVLDTFLIAASVSNESFGVAFLFFNGQNWIGYKTSLPSRDVYSVSVHNENVFAVSDSGFYYSRGVDSNWVHAGLEDQSISEVIIFNNYIFVGTENSVIWKRPLSEIITSVDNKNAGPPEHYKLEQNYPNPFNPYTRIDYSVPRESYISLKVYNLLGEEIAILFEGLQEAGNFTTTFNGNGLAAGIYFYRLSGDGFKQTKKLLLIK